MEAWYYEEDVENEESGDVLTEYDITASPNDFNIRTIYDFIESGTVKVPGFQRNYVWDLKRASKLIESIIIGIPIPQIFLYERARNEFLVIDGQQRLMSIYYFIKQRFPRKEKRTELRKIYDKEGSIPDVYLYNDSYFTKFDLRLPEQVPDKVNKLNRLNYSTLGELKVSFELRTIRNIIIKQNRPEGDHSSIYEIFNRLNTGGQNLKAQEIRSSLYHSPFYELLSKINLDNRWRRILGQVEPDIHMKDIEVLLRGFAMLYGGNEYKPSMIKFLNSFSSKSRSFDSNALKYLTDLFNSFLSSCSLLSKDVFLTRGRFNISMYEAVFYAVCKPYFLKQKPIDKEIDPQRVSQLKCDKEFQNSIQHSTTSKENVKMRHSRAEYYLVKE